LWVSFFLARPPSCAIPPLPPTPGPVVHSPAARDRTPDPASSVRPPASTSTPRHRPERIPPRRMPSKTGPSPSTAEPRQNTRRQNPCAPAPPPGPWPPTANVPAPPRDDASAHHTKPPPIAHRRLGRLCQTVTWTITAPWGATGVRVVGRTARGRTEPAGQGASDQEASDGTPTPVPAGATPQRTTGRRLSICRTVTWTMTAPWGATGVRVVGRTVRGRTELAGLDASDQEDRGVRSGGQRRDTHSRSGGSDAPAHHGTPPLDRTALPDSHVDYYCPHAGHGSPRSGRGLERVGARSWQGGGVRSRAARRVDDRARWRRERRSGARRTPRKNVAAASVPTRWSADVRRPHSTG
jgi:hypothetical protein